MDDEQKEVKKRMRRFIAADNALRRPKKISGVLISFTKFLLVVALLGGAIYGIYIWHPWKRIAESTEGENIGTCKYGYKTTRAIEVLGIRFNESESVLCKGDVKVE